MICERWQVVVVPFPFVDSPQAKRRPALVLSGSEFNRHGHTISSMITTKSEPAWPGDVAIRDRESAGLPRACLVRLKLFTLDNRLMIKRLGRLDGSDRESVGKAIQTAFTD